MQSVELVGAIVPLVTPFDLDEAFDPTLMRRLVEFVIGQGADGLMPTALTGEGPLLTTSETLAVWDVVLESAAGRLPVVPAIISTTTREAVDRVRAAETRGAAAVMVVPILPELYAGRSHDDVFAFYSEIATVTSLPIVLFNYPSLTGIDFIPDLVVRLAEIDGVRYIKESSGDAKRVHGIQRLVGERPAVICGAPNTALESLALGCRAWITGIMNVVPRSAQQLMRAVADLGDLGLARQVYYCQILPRVVVMMHASNPTGTIKAGLHARGVAVGDPRRPGRPVAPLERSSLEGLVAEIARAEEKITAELAARLARSE